MVLLLGTIILLTLNYIVLLGYVWKLCMGINISVQYNGGFLPDMTVDPKLPSGNSVKYHAWAVYLTPTRYIIV